jgi:hypothetical protein
MCIQSQAGESTSRPDRTREDDVDEEEVDDYALGGGEDADDLI